MKAVCAIRNTCLPFNAGGFYLSTNWSVCFDARELYFHHFVRPQWLHKNIKSKNVAILWPDLIKESDVQGDIYSYDCLGCRLGLRLLPISGEVQV